MFAKLVPPSGPYLDNTSAGEDLLNDQTGINVNQKCSLAEKGNYTITIKRGEGIFQKVEKGMYGRSCN